jgi:ATP-dependent DNA ligase
VSGYIRPQLAFDLGVHDAHDPLAAVPRAGWVMEPKFDGWRWQVHVNELSGVEVVHGGQGVVPVKAKEVRCFGGRNGKEHTGSSKLVEEAAAHLPGGTILDGELIGGGYSSDVAHLLSAQQPVTMIVFDVLAVAGRVTMTLPWSERRKLLEAAIPDDQDAVLRRAPVAPVDEEIYGAWMEAGMEGVVCKRTDAPYRPGSRRRDGFVKVKPSLTTDAYVIGWEWGAKESNKDRCGALKIKLVETGADTTTGWGGTPAEANAMVGRRVEIRHWGFQKSGKVRHPVFLRTREDVEEVREAVDVGGATLLEKTTTKKERKMTTDRLTKPVREPAEGAWLRNYAAMGDAKLLRCIKQLEEGSGEAVDRVESNGGSVELNLERARDVARGKGLIA